MWDRGLGDASLQLGSAEVFECLGTATMLSREWYTRILQDETTGFDSCVDESGESALQEVCQVD